MSDVAITPEVPASVIGSLAEFTAEIVSAYVAHNSVPPFDEPTLIRSVHGTLAELGAPEPTSAEPGKPTPPASIRRSVTGAHIISLEDGKPYKALKRHLAKLGLTPDSYRAKWNLPADYPMVVPPYSRARSTLAKELGLGQKR